VGVRLLHLDQQVGVIIVIIIAIVMQMSVESIVATVDFFPLAAHFCLVPWLRLEGQASSFSAFEISLLLNTALGTDKQPA